MKLALLLYRLRLNPFIVEKDLQRRDGEVLLLESHVEVAPGNVEGVAGASDFARGVLDGEEGAAEAVLVVVVLLVAELDLGGDGGAHVCHFGHHVVEDEGE